MFVSSGQFVNLLILVGVGLLSGLIADFLTPMKDCKIYLLRVISIALYFAVCFLAYLFIKNYKNMGSLRLYMPTVFLAAMYFSYIIFHKMLAFFQRKVYNNVVNITKRITRFCKKAVRSGQNACGKVKKINSFVCGNGGSSAVYTAQYNGLPDDFDKNVTKKNRRVRRAKGTTFGRKVGDGRQN